MLQFQGASGEHLLSNEEMNATYQKMIAAGAVFENGIYRGTTPSGGKKNKDSYVAIWEEHEGRKLTFPKARYRAPVMMQPQFYSWLPDRERPGIETKHLGTFNEMRTGMGFFRLLPGATLAAGTQKEAELRYLVEGSCRYAGKEWGEGTYLYHPARRGNRCLRFIRRRDLLLHRAAADQRIRGAAARQGTDARRGGIDAPFQFGRHARACPGHPRLETRGWPGQARA